MIPARKSLFLAIIFIVFPATVFAALSDVEELGKNIFFDQDLSINHNQSCASCHAPEAGWTGPDSNINLFGAVYEGSVPGRFGNRKPPSAAYGGDSPLLIYDVTAGWVGGMFWDGRATGWTLGDPLAEQAQGPFLNPLEQALPDAATLVSIICSSSYAKLFKTVWGNDACGDAQAAYVYVARSIAAYERSKEVSSFTSKYDYWIKGLARLTAEEKLGFDIFNGKGKCSSCHVPPLFTDFGYDNLGVPKNPYNPFYYESEWNPDGFSWLDNGLGGFLKSAGYDPAIYESEMGKHKVPTLRNTDKRPFRSFVKAYSHNGYFKSLKEIVHFYNTRDVLGNCDSKNNPKPGHNCWPAPEIPINVDGTLMGNLGLTCEEEDAIVRFLKILSDGYRP